MESPPPPTRERIIEAAGTLFYAEGLRAISMDGIAAAAGVTKRTLYYHFRSKDDLIAAWLATRDQPNLTAFQRWFARAEGDVANKIRAIFDHLARAARRRNWKGCGFLRASVELVNLPGHPAIVVARAHKKRIEDWLCAELLKAAIAQAKAIAAQIILLLDGAFAVVLLHREPAYFETAGEAAAALIRRQMAAAASGRCPQ